MKRSHEQLFDLGELHQRTDGHGSKCQHVTTAPKMPSSFLQSNCVLDEWVLIALQSVIDGSCIDSSLMETDITNTLHFLVFLDAQGKEYIDEIRTMFPDQFNSIVFVSLDIHEEHQESRVHCSTTAQCKELALYFRILDPLGGGTYPLNYLVVTDAHQVVRCKLPLRIGPYHSLYQCFGVSLTQLQVLIEEYLDFFAQSHISISF